MKSILDVEKATYYGYSFAVNTKNGLEYNLGFRPNGLHDSKGQFVIRTCMGGVWDNIVNRKENCKIGCEFLLSFKRSL